MTHDEIRNIISITLQKLWQDNSSPFPWRPPLVAVADAADPLFNELKNAVSESHFLPRDLLPGARSVICFFLPFSNEIIESNKNEGLASHLWARAYIDTNSALNAVAETLAGELSRRGHQSATAPATHNFLPEKCISDWSHRHAAFIAGLGTFGMNNMLITKSGCAGRVSSLVTSCKIEKTERPTGEYCLYKKNGTCLYCVKKCPTGALTPTGFDRFTCYNRLLQNDRHHNLKKETDVCGKCVAGLPCSMRTP